MSFTPAAGPTPNSSYAVQEKAKLRKVLRRVDLVLFATAAIITLETLAATASSGGQAIVWLLVTLFIFFVPYSLIMAELGSTFPLEGGPYEWPRRAFGRLGRAGGMGARASLGMGTQGGPARRIAGGRGEGIREILQIMNGHSNRC